MTKDSTANATATSTPDAVAANRPLLKVEDLHLYLGTSFGQVRAVEGVSFELAPGRSLAIIGESGCGKTSLTRGILRLLPRT